MAGRLPPLEPTPAQLRRLESIKKEFGSAVHKTYTISRNNRHMHVRLNSQAGMWQWSFDPDGNMRHSSLDMTLQLEDMNARPQGPTALSQEPQ